LRAFCLPESAKLGGYPNGMPAQITSADDSFIFNLSLADSD